jgi:hypothetical protein
LVRDLWLGGSQLKNLIVWTEWFCGRRDPLVSVRWSDFVAIDSYGVAHAPVSVLVNHPAEGFTNTSHIVEESGPHAKILQVMKTRRKVPHGTLIPIGGSPAGLPTDPFSV